MASSAENVTALPACAAICTFIADFTSPFFYLFVNPTLFHLLLLLIGYCTIFPTSAANVAKMSPQCQVKHLNLSISSQYHLSPVSLCVESFFFSTTPMCSPSPPGGPDTCLRARFTLTVKLPSSVIISQQSKP